MTTGPITVDIMHIQISLDDGTTFAGVSCQNNAAYSPSIDTIERDCKQAGNAADHIKGKVRFQVSGGGEFRFDQPVNYKVLHDKMVLGDAKAKIRFTTGSSESGDYYIAGDVLITALPLNSSAGSNGIVSYEYEMLGVGLPVIEVIP